MPGQPDEVPLRTSERKATEVVKQGRCQLPEDRYALEDHGQLDECVTFDTDGLWRQDSTRELSCALFSFCVFLSLRRPAVSPPLINPEYSWWSGVTPAESKVTSQGRLERN